MPCRARGITTAKSRLRLRRRLVRRCRPNRTKPPTATRTRSSRAWVQPRQLLPGWLFSGSASSLRSVDPLQRSMSGHGEAHRREGGVSVAVEVRTVNNRYFKLSVRNSEGYSSLEPQIEAIVRESVRRGTVQINLRIDRE